MNLLSSWLYFPEWSLPRVLQTLLPTCSLKPICLTRVDATKIRLCICTVCPNIAWMLKDKKNLHKLVTTEITKAMESMVILAARKNTKCKADNLPYLHQFLSTFFFNYKFLWKFKCQIVNISNPKSWRIFGIKKSHKSSHQTEYFK